MDADAAGGAVTGGLIASTFEKPSGQAGERRTTCSDCGAAVSGNFCAACGQPTHVHRKLSHLGEELLHGVMHFDGRIWRTLPLLVFNPGRLTREWIEGRRTRYVSPLAAFLFTVFLMFFVFSVLGAGLVSQAPLEERRAAAEVAAAAASQSLADAERDAALATSPEAKAAAASELEDAREAAKRARESLEWLRNPQRSNRDDGLEPGTWQAEVRDAVTNGKMTVNTGSKDFDNKIKKKMLNPDLAAYKIQQTFYKFSFLLVPLSIPAVALLFAWKRGFTWYDHGVFVLYSLTFMALLFMALVLTERFPDWLTSILSFVGLVAAPAHMFAQLKGTYGLKWPSALWRTLALLWLSFFVMVAFVLIMVLLGLAG